MIFRDAAGAAVTIKDSSSRPIWGGAPSRSVRRGVAGELWRTGRVGTGRTGERTYWSPHRAWADATEISLTYGGNLPPGVTMPLAASITVGGDRHVLTWGGDTETVLNGDTKAVSDPAPLTVHPGDTIEVLTYYGARSDGGQHPGAPGAWYSTEILQGNRVADGSPSQVTSERYDGYSGYRPAMPHAITGMTASGVESWVLLGDSITESGAPNFSSVGKVSTAQLTWSHRAILGPVNNTAVWGSSYAPSPTGTWATIPDLAQFTHALVAWGYNDLDQAWQVSSRDVAHVQRNAIAAWSWIGAEVPRVWQATVSPSTDSVDGWATIDGQTPRPALPYRLAFNAWLRDGAPLNDGSPAEVGDASAVRAGESGHPLAGVIDQAARVESAPGSGIFRVDHGPLTADGGHPNAMGHDLMSEALAAIQP